jgi:glycosyltransferase involved in cell wall biosynthesis
MSADKHECRSRRLMYIGDVAPSNSYGGSLLLYRLFETHPSERLCVICVEPDGPPVSAAEWIVVRKTWPRLMRTRLAGAAGLFETARAWLPSSSVNRAIRRFRPEAIVTVWHGSGWARAWGAARRHRLPLALIVHDEAVTDLHQLPPSFGQWRGRVLKRFYQETAVRFCVSPEMASEYERRYGIPARVLYPGLAMGAQIGMTAPADVRGQRPMNFLYAGSIHSDGIVDRLAELGRCLGERGARLIIYTAAAARLREDVRFCQKGIEVRDPVPAGEISACIRRSADVLVAIVDHLIGLNGKLLFPTKLAEYTAYGLPILMFAPRGSAAANWAAGPPQRAMCVDQPSSENALAAAVSALSEDGALRQSLIDAALDAARSTFAHDVLFRVLEAGIEDAIAAVGARANG